MAKKKPLSDEEKKQEIEELVNDPKVRAALDILKDLVAKEGIDLGDLPDRTRKKKKTRPRRRKGTNGHPGA